MALHAVPLPGITIPNGTAMGTTILFAHRDFEDAEKIYIQAPAVLAETLRIRTSTNPAAAVAADFVDLLNPNNAAVYTIGAGQGLCIECRGVIALTLGTTGNVAADRVFSLSKGVEA